MRWPWSSRDRVPRDGDLSIVVTIQWGLAKLTVVTADTAPRLWLHRFVVDAEARPRDGGDPVADRYIGSIREPIRMSPSGRFDDAWRPGAFDLGDGMHHRPTFTAVALVSTDRRRPHRLTTDVEVVDQFRWADGRYDLIEGTPLWNERHDSPERPF